MIIVELYYALQTKIWNKYLSLTNTLKIYLFFLENRDTNFFPLILMVKILLINGSSAIIQLKFCRYGETLNNQSIKCFMA